MKSCSRCILPSSCQNIRFDAEGVCNYCRTYEKLKRRLTDFERLRLLFEERLERHRGRFDYDVLVGISGGKDSSYLLYTLKNDYSLRVLSFTYDNGFLNDFAKQNIKRVVEKLEVDHVFYKPNREVHWELYRGATSRLGRPCFGCVFPGSALTFKIALERGIPFTVHGRSRSQMFRELLPGSLDPFIPVMWDNLSPYNVEGVRAPALSALKRRKLFLRLLVPWSKNRKKISEELFPDPEHIHRAEVVPESLAFFLYHPYNEELMKSVLEEKVNRERPKGDDIHSHHDCEIHDAITYFRSRCFGQPLLTFELSVDIREGRISRDEALGRLRREKALWNWPAESMSIFGERLGFSEKDIRYHIRKNRLKDKILRLALRTRSLLLRPQFQLNK